MQYKFSLLTLDSPADVCAAVTTHAIKSGYRHVDSATVYRNEEPAAKGMLAAGIEREQLFFTSKVPPKEINYQDAKKCVDESLKKTGLAYIDLYLLHAPYGGRDGRLGAWKVRAFTSSSYSCSFLVLISPRLSSKQ